MFVSIYVRCMQGDGPIRLKEVKLETIINDFHFGINRVKTKILRF